MCRCIIPLRGRLLCPPELAPPMSPLQLKKLCGTRPLQPWACAHDALSRVPRGCLRAVPEQRVEQRAMALLQSEGLPDNGRV